MKDLLFFGGSIVTMADTYKPEAVLVRDGKIFAVGTAEKLRALSPSARQIDLKGHLLLPGLIDGHSHITSFSSTLRLVPLQDCADFDAIKKKIAAFRDQHPDAKWISGFGYDHNFLAEHRHPDKQLLDEAGGGVPVLIAHASGHMGVASSGALRALGIDASVQNPAGGVIGRMPGSREPNGYLEETAFTQITSQVPKPDEAAQLEALEQAQDIYLSHGITTVQDGLTRNAEWKLLCAAASAGKLKVDVVSYPDFIQNRELLELEIYRGKYTSHLKIGGGKLFLDGSPQGRTAWMSQPYLGDEPGYCGYPPSTRTETSVAGCRTLCSTISSCFATATATPPPSNGCALMNKTAVQKAAPDRL